MGQTEDTVADRAAARHSGHVTFAAMCGSVVNQCRQMIACVEVCVRALEAGAKHDGHYGSSL